MNREVQVTGMELKTKVSSNLLICNDNVEEHYTDDVLTQARKALLEPASTVNATDTGFYYTLDAAADGHKIHPVGTDPYVAYSESTNLTAADTDAGKSKYDTGFNTAYGITTANTTGAYKTAYGYVDYVFYLKATTDAANQSINMTRCNMIWDNSGTDTVLTSDDTAWRVAVFASDITTDHGGDGDTSATPSTGTAKSILTPSGAANFGDESGTHKAVSGTAALSTVAYNQSAVIDTISAANTTKYYKVVVRVWIEGEDTNCYSEYFAEKLELYKLDLAFELGKGTAVTNIGSTTTAFVPAVN